MNMLQLEYVGPGVMLGIWHLLHLMLPRTANGLDMALPALTTKTCWITQAVACCINGVLLEWFVGCFLQQHVTITVQKQGSHAVHFFLATYHQVLQCTSGSLVKKPLLSSLVTWT